MKTYKITEDAKIDLIEIAQYTLNKWNKNTFIEYRDGLERVFDTIANHTIIQRNFSEKLSDVFVTKYKYHFIFYIYKNNTPIVIAVIHEKRDILKYLIHRLET